MHVISRAEARMHTEFRGLRHEQPREYRGTMHVKNLVLPQAVLRCFPSVSKPTSRTLRKRTDKVVRIHDRLSTNCAGSIAIVAISCAFARNDSSYDMSVNFGSHSTEPLCLLPSHAVDQRQSKYDTVILNGIRHNNSHSSRQNLLLRPLTNKSKNFNCLSTQFVCILCTI